LFFLFFLNIIAWLYVNELNKKIFLEVNFFDVGQGDSAFIETPAHQQIIIDGGPSSVILEKLAKEMPFWDRNIDLMILSHPDYDHLAGLLEVLKKYKVENILWTGIVADNDTFKEWQRLIGEEDANVKIAKAGEIIKFLNVNNENNKYIEVFYPFESIEGEKPKNTNNSSIVLKLVFGSVSFLFPGDIYNDVEKELIEKRSDIRADVLKIAHHGSKTSSSEEFIKEVSPEVAVISVGKDNKYGHPHQQVLDTLAKYDITALRTDKDGDIKILSDGNNYKIE